MGQIESLRQAITDLSGSIKGAVAANDWEKVQSLADDLGNVASNGVPDIPFPMLGDGKDAVTDKPTHVPVDIPKSPKPPAKPSTRP